MRFISRILTAVLIVGSSLALGSPALNKEQRAEVGSLIKASREAIGEREYDAALASLARVKQIDPKNQDAFYYVAIAHMGLKDTAQAVTVLTEGVEKAPLSSRIKLLLARVHMYGHKNDEAQNLIDSVFRFKPNNAEALYLSGMVSLARGDSAKALELWQAALEKSQKKGSKR